MLLCTKHTFMQHHNITKVRTKGTVKHENTVNTVNLEMDLGARIWSVSKLGRFQSFHMSVKLAIRNLLIVSNFKMCEESLRTLYGIIGANIEIYVG